MAICALVLLCAVSMLTSARSQASEGGIRGGNVFEMLVCLDNELCSSCLQAAQHCRWCADPNFNHNNTLPRCNTRESLISAGCPPSSIQSQKDVSQTILADEQFSDMTLGDTTVPVQIKPQKLKLALRPREPFRVNFEYRPARNYPLDLYYLMDLSWSMQDDKRTLVGLRNDLPKALQNLTDNFRIGFGSFADKPLMPYTFLDERRRDRPCPVGEDIDFCEPTYNFRHQLKLTNVVDEFINKVRDSNITANVDNLEGGTDALIQAAVCQDEIGWSKIARKIILFASDGLMHFAGDGKLGGVTERNVDTCYLNENGLYYGDTRFDYPSLEEIYRTLDTRKIKVIFAVTEEIRQYYDSIHELLPVITVVEKLENDSSNIIKLVKEGYEEISSIINFEQTSDDIFKVGFFSDCGIEGGPFQETHRCEDVQIGKSYQFSVNIIMQSCPADLSKLVRTIVINETQLGQQALEIEVELLCDCDCNRVDESNSKMSSKCPANSNETCGICRCVGGWSGPNCDCDTTNEDNKLLLEACKPDGGASHFFPCSGEGDCVCGECQCDRGFSGKYCQCKRCDQSPINGLECGGNFYGVCDCGQCACRVGWSGAACDCPEGEDRCIAPGDNTPCSGRGDCHCGECQCKVDKDIRYTGDYCEKCANCENRVCSLYEGCVLCTIRGSCNKSECISETGTFYSANVINENRAPQTNMSICFARAASDEISCDYSYTYQVLRDWTVKLDIYLKTKTCSAPIKLGQVMSFIVGGVILLGLMMIVAFKLWQMRQDKIAYARFLVNSEKNMMKMSNLADNPIYISPISRYRMPDEYKGKHD